MATLIEHTLLPEATEPYEALRLALESGELTLLDSDRRTVDLPPGLVDVMRDVARALEQGLAVTVAPTATVLTTQQAADYLAVSRPTLVKLLESGQIAFEKPGQHRRVRLSDVLAYREQTRHHVRSGLDAMAAETGRMSVEDLPTEYVKTR